MDPKQIEAMMSWPAPRKLTGVKSTMGLTGIAGSSLRKVLQIKVESMYRLRKHACEFLVP